jgi:uncharacterized membrane protein YidH (DUF202 family)
MVKRLIRHGKRLLRRRKKQPDYKQEKILLLREQTILAKERTVLSFIRTGLASIGAGIVIINIFSSDPSSFVVGWAFVMTGIVEIVESYRRLRRYQKKMGKISRVLGE